MIDKNYWAEMHGEYGNDPEVVNETRTTYAHLANEHVDYEIMVHIRDLDNGQRIVEVESELLKVFDDEGTLVDSFEVTLPPKIVKELTDKAEEYVF